MAEVYGEGREVDIAGVAGGEVEGDDRGIGETI